MKFVNEKQEDDNVAVTSEPTHCMSVKDLFVVSYLAVIGILQ